MQLLWKLSQNSHDIIDISNTVPLLPPPNGDGNVYMSVWSDLVCLSVCLVRVRVRERVRVRKLYSKSDNVNKQR